jgi:Glycosyl hydrolase family 12
VRQIIARHGADTAPGAGSRRIPVTRLSRGALAGVVAACAVLAGGGVAAASFLGGGTTSGARQAAVKNVTVGGGGAGNAAAAMPQVAASPRLAVMPKPTATARRTGGASPGGSATAPASAGSVTCAHPSFVTSDQYGMWNLAPYFVGNNMWGTSGYSVTQTLYACSYSDWYVVADMNNDSGDGHVKTYPNAHRDFDNEPAISSLQSVTSTFAETSPGTGIYEDAYDIWLNGIATSGSTEVMIWTENHGQVPSGSQVATVTLDGRSWAVWRAGTYIAFVATSNFTSGTMNLLTFFQWITGQGWMPSNSTLGQVDYGAELVSTNNVPATFTFGNFSVNAS